MPTDVWTVDPVAKTLAFASKVTLPEVTNSLLAITSMFAAASKLTVPVCKATPEPVSNKSKPPSIITPPTDMET